MLFGVGSEPHLYACGLMRIFKDAASEVDRDEYHIAVVFFLFYLKHACHHHRVGAKSRGRVSHVNAPGALRGIKVNHIGKSRTHVQGYGGHHAEHGILHIFVAEHHFAVDNGAVDSHHIAIVVWHTFEPHRQLSRHHRSQGIVLYYRQGTLHAAYFIHFLHHSIGMVDGFARCCSDGQVGVEHGKFAAHELRKAVEHR